MQYILLNARPILAATLAGFFLSVAYAATGGAGMGGARRTAGLAALAFVAQGWVACILAGALILAPRQAGAWTMALGSAAVIWVGFILPTLVVTLRFRGSRAGAALGDALAWLAIMLVQAAVLQLVGLARPG